MATAKASFEELVQCSICLDRFTHPKVLPCQHTFCSSCLKGFVKDAKIFNCPTCRRRTNVPKQGIQEFEDNLVIKNLLDIMGETPACNDCERSQVLSKCEHCNRQVCADCRAVHNRLLAELTSKMKCLQLEIDQSHLTVESSTQTLNKLLEEKKKVRKAFHEAAQSLSIRQEAILANFEPSVRLHQSIIAGKNDLFHGFHKQPEDCVSCEDFQSVQEELLKIEEGLKSIHEELAFNYDIAHVTNFGEIVHSSKVIAQETAGDAKEEKDLGDRGACLQVLSQTSAGSAESTEAMRPMSSTVNIEPDIREPDGSLQPSSRTVLKPTFAQYSTHYNSLLCITNGEIFMYNDVETGQGRYTGIRAKHFAVSDTGVLWSTNGKRVQTDRLDHPINSITVQRNNVHTLGENSYAAQIVCKGTGAMVLETGQKRLLLFQEAGDRFRKLDLSSRICSDVSKMCVGGDGKIYIASVHILDRTESADWDYKCPNNCSLSKTVAVRWELVIFILSWDGGEGEELRRLVVDGGTTSYCYDFSVIKTRCPREKDEIRRVFHRRRVEASVPDNQQFLCEVEPMSDICVDGDYIYLTRRAKNEIAVYRIRDGQHVSTIGKDELNQPNGVSLLPDGRLVICDTGNNRIRIA